MDPLIKSKPLQIQAMRREAVEISSAGVVSGGIRYPRVSHPETHMCEGSHRARIGKVIRIIKRIRSVTKQKNTAENRRKRHLLHDALDYEHVHADRRVDQAELDRHDDDDAEPDRIELAVAERVCRLSQ